MIIVFMKHTVQCSPMFTIQSLVITLDYRKPMSLSGPVFTFIHDLISSDFSIRFILQVETSPDAEKIRSTYARDAGAVSKSWVMCASLSKTSCFCCQTLHAKLDPA